MLLLKVCIYHNYMGCFFAVAIIHVDLFSCNKFVSSSSEGDASVPTLLNTTPASTRPGMSNGICNSSLMHGILPLGLESLLRNQDNLIFKKDVVDKLHIQEK
jgi:hypothetical protein